MVKATNPHTQQSEIVTDEQANAMKRGVACREYHFEVLQPFEAAEPPAVEPPEHLPTPPPVVNMPESATPFSHEPEDWSQAEEGAELPPFLARKKVTNRPAKQGH